MSKDMRRNVSENAGGGATAPLTPTNSLYSSLSPNEHSQDNTELTEAYLSILLCH